MTRTLLVPIYAPLPSGPLIQPVPDTVYIPLVSVEYISPLFIDFISLYFTDTSPGSMAWNQLPWQETFQELCSAQGSLGFKA